MGKTIILMPTYNERENVALLLPELFEQYPAISVLVIDDSSPDGTGDEVLSLTKKYPNLSLLLRPGKQGLGEAYKAGMHQVLKDPTIEVVITMDADGSHAPEYVGALLSASFTHDLVIGSRYVHGGGVENWEMWRMLLSRFGNIYARVLSGLPVRDITAGFMCFRASILRRIDFSQVHASGYAFLQELKFYTIQLGGTVQEVPILFRSRREGESKISRHIIREGLKTPWRLFYRRIPTMDAIFFSLRAVFRAHMLAIFGALIMTVLVSSTVIAFPFYAGDKYAGINIPNFGSDEHHYLTRGKEVLEGHNTGQIVLSIDKNLPDPTFSSIERILLFPITVIGAGEKVNIVTVYNILNFLGVFVLILILYAFSYALSRDKLLSLAAALFVIGGYSIVYHKTLFYNDFNIYNRSVIPYAATVPFFLYCLFLFRSHQGVRSFRHILAVGGLLALLFYEYFYAWTFALSLTGALFLIQLSLKRYQSALYIAASSIIALILAVPMLVGFVRYYTSPAAKQLSFFLLTSSGHTPVLSLIGSITLLLLGVYWFFHRNDRNIPYIIALISAGWIALNEQVLTGRYIQYGHYYWYFIVPLSIVVGVYMVGFLLPPQWRRWFAYVLIALALINTVGGQYKSFFTTTDIRLHEQVYAPIITELQNLPKANVFAEDNGDTYPTLVTIYTDDDLYYHGLAESYNVPVDYMEESLLLHLYLNKEARKDPIGFLQNDLNAQNQDDYTAQYQEIEGYYSGFEYYPYKALYAQNASSLKPLRTAFLASLKQKYAELFPTPDSAKNLLVSRGVKYVVWDKMLNPEWDLAPLKLHELTQSGSVVLYGL
jgi:dolichol-phosphate mannosyltransferase